MLLKIVSHLGLPKLISSWLGVSSVSYSRPSYSPEQMILKSHVFLHACRTPLTVIRCCVDELTSNEHFSENEQLISSLESSVDKLQELFSEVSSSSPNKTIKITKFNLSEVVANISMMLRPRFPSAIIYNEIDSNIEITGNRLYLEEALRCVAINALEAYRPGTKQHLYLIARKRRKNIQIDIIDLGFGMNKRAKKIALVGGFSYKSHGSGVGLGFATYTIEKLFHGKMHVFTEFGIGTRVTWQIPL